MRPDSSIPPDCWNVLSGMARMAVAGFTSMFCTVPM